MQAIFKILCVTATLFSHLGNATSQVKSVINDNVYNVEIRLHDTYGPIGIDGNGSVGEQVYVVSAANDTDGAPTSLFDNTVEENIYDLCYYIFSDHSGWHSDLAGVGEIDSLVMTIEGNTSGYIDFEAAVWENDTGPLCEFNQPGGDNDDRYDSLTDTLRIMKDSITGFSQDTITTFQIPTSDARIKLRTFWRYTSGVRQNPLDFNALTDNSVYRHVNTTQSASIQTAVSSYTNQWTDTDNVAFTDAPDVTYEFQIGKYREVVVSGDFDFDGQLHLVRIDCDAGFLQYLENDAGTDIINTHLYPGSYGIIVEGSSDPTVSNPATGDFALEILTTGTATAIINPSPEGIIYVATYGGGSQDGSSWNNAAGDLQTAISKASPGDRVWVAQGTYYPTGLCSDRSASFHLPDSVGVFGGFKGLEASTFDLSLRDFSTYQSILSGDIGQKNHRLDNSYNVVQTYLNTAHFINKIHIELNGFTISNGYNTESIRGAAGWRHRGNFLPHIENVIFKDNDSYRAGSLSILSFTDSLVGNIVNCKFINNTCSGDGGSGGFIELRGSHNSMNIINCEYSRNTDKSRGTLIFQVKHDANNNIINISDCSFDNDTTLTDIKFAIFGDSVKVNISNVIFLASNDGNQNSYNLYVDLDRGTKSFVQRVQGCQFGNPNRAFLLSNNGEKSKIFIDRSIFSKSPIAYLGSANDDPFYIDTFLITNSVFHETEVEIYPGKEAPFFPIRFSNCTFTNNSRAIFYNNLGSDAPIKASIKNSIFHNTPVLQESHPNIASEIILKNSRIDANDCSSFGPNSNCSEMIFNQDLLFVSSTDPDGPDDIWGTADDGLRLRRNSPAINKGTDSLNYNTDFISQEHIYQPDMGAYEYPCDMQNYTNIPDITNIDLTYRGLTTIEASNIIHPSSTVIYEASQYILLKPGFEIKANNMFEAVINSADCY